MQPFELWNRLGFPQRVMLVLALVVVVLGTAFAAWWALSDDYEILFSKLEPRDVATVTQRLDADRIPYHLVDGGRSVTVPSGNSFKIRAKLLEQGITPAGGLGFELFDNAELGLTDFAQQVNYQRALQGELSRTIGALGGVESARVHIVIPERRLFDVDANQAKASDTLNLKEGVPFPHERVDGIRRLVSSAVPRLQPENVDIHDSAGVELRGAQTEADTSSISARLKQKQEFESYLEQKAQRALDAMLGEGQALVKLDVSLNLNKIDSVKEQPLTGAGEGVVVRSKATTTTPRKRRSKASVPVNLETPTIEGATTEAVVETPDRVATPPAVLEGKSTQTETLYQVGRLSERMNVAPGSITRITGSVLVPLTLSEENHESVRSLVAGIVGLQESRGDSLRVLAKLKALRLPPVEAEVTAADELPASENPVRDVRPWVMAVVGVLALMWLLALGVRRNKGVQRLSDAERREQLERLRRWLGEEQRA